MLLLSPFPAADPRRHFPYVAVTLQVQALTKRMPVVLRHKNQCDVRCRRCQLVTTRHPPNKKFTAGRCTIRLPADIAVDGMKDGWQAFHSESPTMENKNINWHVFLLICNKFSTFLTHNKWQLELSKHKQTFSMLSTTCELEWKPSSITVHLEDVIVVYTINRSAWCWIMNEQCSETLK